MRVAASLWKMELLRLVLAVLFVEDPTAAAIGGRPHGLGGGEIVATERDLALLLQKASF
jgi:hypothetical protein